MNRPRRANESFAKYKKAMRAENKLLKLWRMGRYIYLNGSYVGYKLIPVASLKGVKNGSNKQ